MTTQLPADWRQRIDALYRDESRRALATLIRLLGDFDLAEEALHEAFSAALEQWPRDGMPDNPRAWLVSTGRFTAIDRIRRRAHLVSLEDVPETADIAGEDGGEWIDAASIEDDRLRLIFTCCHPALAPDAQIALTLLHEQLAGFYMIDAKDLDDALQIAAKIPPARTGSIEARPVRELDTN